MTFHLRMKILLLSVLLLKTTKTSKAFSQVLATFIKILQLSILHFEMYIYSLNGEYKILS